MKLELKHLAPYLPYKLKGNIFSDNKQWSLVGIKEETCLCQKSDYKNTINISILNFKPILRPLSDLDKKNEEGKNIYFPSSNLKDVIIKGLDIKSHCYFSEIIYLLKNHFDVFGLIEKGLAIDINTLS